MRRNVCGGILVLALLAGAAGTSSAQETGTPIFKAPVPGVHNHEFGVSLSDPGEGVSLALGGLLPLREGRQRLQPPRRVRRPGRLGRHPGPARRRLPHPGAELQRELPARRLAHARPRRQRRRRATTPTTFRSASRSAAASISRAPTRPSSRTCTPSSSPPSAAATARSTSPSAWASTSASASSGPSARAVVSATSRASASAWRTSADRVSRRDARPRTPAAGRSSLPVLRD